MCDLKEKRPHIRKYSYAGIRTKPAFGGEKQPATGFPVFIGMKKAVRFFCKIASLFQLKEGNLLYRLFLYNGITSGHSIARCKCR